MNINIDNVINQLWDVRCRRVEDEEEIRDIAFLALNTMKIMKEQLEQKRLGSSESQIIIAPENQELLSKLKPISELLTSENDKTVLMMLSKKLQEQESDLRDMYRISSTKDVHLTRNGKEIMALTHENTLLLEVIKEAPNKEELLKQLDELKKIPLI
jgi:hypothetical protein